MTSLQQVILSKTNRLAKTQKVQNQILPTILNDVVAGTVRQLDVLLLQFGWKLSTKTIGYLLSLNKKELQDVCEIVLFSLKEKIGAHVVYNPYFSSFPKNVPNTLEFWNSLVVKTISERKTENFDKNNLLNLVGYGVVQHTFEDMCALHEPFIDNLKSTGVKVITLGEDLQTEATKLLTSLANSSIPLSEDDRKVLTLLCDSVPEQALKDLENVPVRENNALLNEARIKKGITDLAISSSVDVLRLASVLSNGDVTLSQKTKFKSFPRKTRKILLNSLNVLLNNNSSCFEEVNPYKEEWKRLGEKLHPREYSKQYVETTDFFSIARGERKVMTVAGQVEINFQEKNLLKVVELLSSKPGMFMRSLDRVVREIQQLNSTELKVETFQAFLHEFVKASAKTSTKVLISVREHFMNRAKKQETRLFLNTKGTSYVSPDEREPLDNSLVMRFLAILDQELAKRFVKVLGNNVVIEKSMLDVVVPTSDKTKSDGFGILPKGSLSFFNEEILRFFIYWKQTASRTDYDLSVLFLDKDFNVADSCSFRNLSTTGVCHSGDITSAPNGASEFIDIKVSNLKPNVKYIIPQVNLYAGETLEEVEECFFGYMERNEAQAGLPFEEKTVKVKSDLTGKGKVSLPMVFIRESEKSNKLTAKWLHLMLDSQPQFNTVESNKNITKKLTKNVVNRNYFTFRSLVEILGIYMPECTVTVLDSLESQMFENISSVVKTQNTEEVTDNKKVFTPLNLFEVVPA